MIFRKVNVMPKPKVYSRYDLPVVEGTSFENVESLTVQYFKDECDVNRIMKKYHDQGTIPTHLNTRVPQYGDFTSMPSDLTTLMNHVDTAKAYFDSLPSGVRSYFNNDPRLCFDFICDPSNHAEAVKMGLLVEDASSPVLSTASKPSDSSVAAVSESEPGTPAG